MPKPYRYLIEAACYVPAAAAVAQLPYDAMPRGALVAAVTLTVITLYFGVHLFVRALHELLAQGEAER